jgi:hypothetical protein
MTKEKEIWKYSNPNTVRRQIRKYLGNRTKRHIDFKLSTRPTKKYMIRGDFSKGKWIHFGAWKMEDYTKHRNKKRWQNFRTRNRKWKLFPKNTPAYLSYYLLW